MRARCVCAVCGSVMINSPVNSVLDQIPGQGWLAVSTETRPSVCVSQSSSGDTSLPVAF